MEEKLAILFNKKLVERIVKYIDLYKDSVLCFQTYIQNKAADELSSLAEKIQQFGYRDFHTRIELDGRIRNMPVERESKKQMTKKDLYLMAVAEDSLKDNTEGYPIDKWDFLSNEVEEHFDNLSSADQDELESRMTKFVPKISDLCDELGDLEGEDITDFAEKRTDIIREITDMIAEEFSDFIVDDDDE